MISSHVTYEVGRARIDDLRSEADESRRGRREPDDSRPAARMERWRHRSRQQRRALGTLRLRRA
ncbi:MAG TPA: hypothetical protein VHZ27_07460 [Solirubrobacteraceae bacterium]|jgi:hypothetical protein|nr:hypothetical protein [Solirubrobacteraceae bacterium]